MMAFPLNDVTYVFNPLIITFSRYDSLIGGFMALCSSLNRTLEHEGIRRGENLDF